jgi:anti-sigma B factor antagonist
MEIDVKELNRADLIVVNGRVDSSTAPELGQVLNDVIDRGTVNLVVDLSDITYMSSAALRELVAALKRVKKAGGDLRLCAPSERASEVLDLAGLSSIFTIYESQVDAVGSF